MRISSYGCTWEVWRALKKLELLSAVSRATLTHLSCSPNFPSTSINWYTHAKHEQILNSADCRKWLPSKKLLLLLLQVSLDQVYYVLVLTSTNHKARKWHPEMVMALTVSRSKELYVSQEVETMLNCTRGKILSEMNPPPPPRKNLGNNLSMWVMWEKRQTIRVAQSKLEILQGIIYPLERRWLWQAALYNMS